ncbi:uncharacterized protein [Paramisgurnus dabryanus]|uniref:uncharacterized protein n=1 Tax=Paramisgurnus dabryanus TaxID=90735 RepID=UPI0031F3773B
MSTVLLNDAPQPAMSPASMQTSRPLPPHSDSITSKRVCFYKSGDPQFTGHRMVINSRTFKTFDALLDALSKKVPLSFGVRTITTPKGTHAVHNLNELQDGASYLCSDHKKVKPFNLDRIHKTQVPWNTTRPISAGRQARRARVRQLVKRSDGTTRTVKMPENSAVGRTPKRLTVYKNNSPSIKRIIVLQRRTAPNFEALLDYLSKVMQFPVLKLYTEDGRKVDGLPTLILCSGIVVAAGNEPFRKGNYNLQGPTKTLQSNISEPLGQTQRETLLEKNKPAGPITRSRNFSLSSERYLVEQINESLNRSLSEHDWEKSESMETEGSEPIGSEDNCDCRAGVEQRSHPIMPTEDDIEKSFRVNEDGSMTVEMKVHLTIKQEELVHWTTTLSRASINSQQRAVVTAKQRSGVNSLDVNSDSVKESNGPHSLKCKEMNTLTNKSIRLIEKKRESSNAVCQTSEKLKPIYKRLPTPGHRRQRKKTSISETEVQESAVGAYSYMERTSHGELTKRYCMVSRSSSSSTRTLSKPCKSESREIKKKSEILQLQNDGTTGITETVLHVYESQGTRDNYDANTNVENKPKYCSKALPRSRGGSTDSGPLSSCNDCDVDLTRQSTSSDSGGGGKNDMLSLSSASSTPLKMRCNDSHILIDNEQRALGENRSKSTEKKMLSHVTVEEDSDDKWINGFKTTNIPKSKQSKQSTSSESSGLGKRKKASIAGSSKGLQMKNTDTPSHTGSEKNTHSSAKSGRAKTTKTFEGSLKSSNLNLNRKSEKELRMKDKTIKVQASLKPTLKTNFLDNRSHPTSKRKTLPKQRSMNGDKSKNTQQNQKLSESLSLPVLQSSPSNVNQYVENWLQKLQPNSPYDDDTDHLESAPRVVFQIAGGSADGPEIKSEPEKDSVVDEGPSLEDNAVEWPVARLPVQITCEGEPLEAQSVRGFCKSMPSVRLLPAEQDEVVRMHKSSENLAPPDCCNGGGTSQITDVGMKPILKQLCLSIQSIRRASSQNHLEPTVQEKSSSLPDFSSQVASAFGSPSRAFLSFLSLMTLRDGTSILGNSESLAKPEALHIMQSLEKISNIKDEDELKASLTSLQSSTSSHLKQSWRDFRERNVFGESPPLSPRQSEQEFALDMDLGEEECERDEEHGYGIEQLMDELNVTGDLRREISSLVEGELKSETNSNNGHFDNASEITGKVDEHDDGSVNGILEKAADMEEENNYGENIDLLSKDEINYDPKEQKTDLETVKQDLGNDDSGIAVLYQTLEENCSDSSKAEVSETAHNNQMNTETTIGNDPDKSNVEHNPFPTSHHTLTDKAGEDLSELSDDQNNMNDREQIITADNVKDGDTSEQEEPIFQNMREHTEHSDSSDNTDATSEQKVTDFSDVLRNEEQNEDNESDQFSTAKIQDQDCVRDETDTSDSGDEEDSSNEEVSGDEENSADEAEGHEQENKFVLTECEIESKESLTHHCDAPSNHKVHVFDSESQEDDEVLYGDVEDVMTDQQEDSVPEMSEHEDPDYNNTSPEHCSNDENSMTSESRFKTEYDKTQQIDKSCVDEKDSDEANHQFSEDCELVDVHAEPGISDPENVTAKTSRSSTGEVQMLEETKKSKHSPQNDEYAIVQHSYGFVETESCSSIKPNSSDPHLEQDKNVGMVHYLLHPISQELLDVINSALLSSTLTVTHDSNGNLKIEPGKCTMREMFRAQHGQKRLPSPHTSDLSDYRPETSDNDGYQSQASMEILSESEEEEEKRLRIFREILKQTMENPCGKTSMMSSRSSTTKQSPSSNGNNSPSSFQDSKSVLQEPPCYSKPSSLNGNSNLQCVTLNGEVDSEEGVLIDKGRWLLKENHLIRKSPPVSVGMYGTGDTTSPDTCQDNISEGAPYPYYDNPNSPLAVISSSELEDLARPSTPKCTYFNMPHSSGSDPLLDAQSINGSRGNTRRHKELKVSPMGEPSKMSAKKNGSLSSFASVEFKLPDGKVHPLDGAISGAVNTNRSQSLDGRTIEEESRVGLNLRCGQHCPIL